jgi:hypothetical protein
MKRPLSCKDYERMTYASVDEYYVGKNGGSRDLYMALCMQSWDRCARNGYVEGQKEVTWRKHMLHEVYKVESDEPSTRRPLAHMIRDEPKTYRISFNRKGGIEVVCFDLENIDSELEGYYDEVSALPTWVQERIAVLAVCSPNPPTPTVEGIGRRISENVYWVYK